MAEGDFELIAVPGADAERVWAELRESRRGFTPILLGDQEAADRVLETWRSERERFTQNRDLGLQLDVDAWIKHQLEVDPERFSFDEEVTLECSSTPAFLPSFDLDSGRPLARVYFGIIPVDQSWLVPAYLGIGGWNDCPDAEIQTAFFKRWHTRYGAEVTTVTHDVVQFRVRLPPKTFEAALELAREQYVYCTDIVAQGVDTVGNLADTLRGCPDWFFWWD